MMLLRTAHEQEQLSTLSHEQPNRLHGPQLLSNLPPLTLSNLPHPSLTYPTSPPDPL